MVQFAKRPADCLLVFQVEVNKTADQLLFGLHKDQLIVCSCFKVEVFLGPPPDTIALWSRGEVLGISLRDQ